MYGVVAEQLAPVVAIATHDDQNQGASLVPADDAFPAPSVESLTLLHPGTVAQDDAFYAAEAGDPDRTLIAGLVASDDATLAPWAFVPTVLGSPTDVTLSNGNLTADHDTSSTAGARSPDGKNSGKHHFRFTLTEVNGGSSAVCVMTAAATYTNVVVDGTNCFAAYAGTGNLWSNNASTGMTLGALADGDVIDVAIDLDADLGWMRRNGGSWNGSGGANPATGAGGVSLSSYSGTTVSPAICFSGDASEAATALFGGGTLPAATPAGFFPGWAV